MAGALYPQFLVDQDHYREAEAFWTQVWDEVCRLAGQAADWRSPWLSVAFADGTPCWDGNPIFSAVNNRRHLGVRVIQYAESFPEEADLDWWVDSFIGEAEAEPIRELVVSCVLSEETAKGVRDLLLEWVTWGQTPAGDGTQHSP